jgi:hypothetical protein
MGKRGCGVVAENILAVLSTRKLSIQDVSKEAKVSWESAKRHLELFARLSIAREYTEGGKKLYQKMRSTELDTLFSIPLSQEKKDTIKRIFATIEMAWKSPKPLSKTIMQKIAVDVVENIFPDVPRAWYLYGKILLLPYNPDEKYNNPFTDERTIRIVQDICKNYASFTGTAQARRYQYQKNPLYLSKENLSYFLNCADINDIQVKTKIRRYLNEFAFSWERKENNSEILALMEDFCSTALSIFRNKKNINEAREAIISGFEAIWNLIATYEFFDSLTQFYDKELLNDFLSERIKVLKETALEALEELREHDRPEMPKGEIAQKLHSLIGSANGAKGKPSPEPLFKQVGL